MILGDFMDIMDKIQESLQNNKHINKDVNENANTCAAGGRMVEFI